MRMRASKASPIGARGPCALAAWLANSSVRLRIRVITRLVRWAWRSGSASIPRRWRSWATTCAAGEGQIVVSATTQALALGSEVTFEDLGTRELKGLEGARQLYAVTG